VTPCSLLSCNRRFGGTYRLHIQGRRISASIYTSVFRLAVYSASHMLSCWFLLKLFLRPWRWRRYFPPKRRLQLNRLHGVTSQKMILFITDAVKTSNPKYIQWFHISYAICKLKWILVKGTILICYILCLLQGYWYLCQILIQFHILLRMLRILWIVCW
jgi:hypothetical protein